MQIPIGRTGKILAGDDAGWYVQVVDDTADTGGFLILTSMKPDMSGAFDNWVEDLDSLDRYFEESKWQIEWF